MACQAATTTSVQVKNPASSGRTNETVSIPNRDLPASPVVVDAATGRVLDSQIIGDELLFQVTLGLNGTGAFQIKPAASASNIPPPTIKTYARHVPERADDFAWENDRIAFRVYGPALMTDKSDALTSSGVDVWCKRTRDLIINKWYKSGSYHTDHGDGLDFYKVGKTRGCGGIGIWDGGKLYVSQNWKTQRLVATGPIRTEFELTYEAWDANGRKVSEVKRLSLDANSNFTRCESAFESDTNNALMLAIGITKRQGDDTISHNEKEGWLAYWEPTHGADGTIGCAVIVPGGMKFATDNQNLLAVTEVQPGRPLVYYFGAGWDKSGDFKDAQAWQSYVRAVMERFRNPLQISYH